jgi:hypothetical protein
MAGYNSKQFLMSRRIYLTSFVLMWILVGCSSLPFTPTSTPTPPLTPTSTWTPRPTPTSTLTPSPTPVFAAYPWKHVWFKYTVESPAEVTSQFGLTEEPLLVIYTDGMMIASRAGDSKIRTRVLNTKEVCNFINRLDEMGFNALEDSRSTEETNPLYDFGAKYQSVSEGDFASLTVYLTTPKSVSFFEPYRKFLARPMRKIVEFVEAYNPGGFVPYQPDRLILFVQQGRAADVEKTVRARAWDLEAPILRELAEVPYTFLEGAQAVNVFALLTKYGTPIFIESDVEYTVTMRLLYPHEIVDVGSVPVATPTESRFPVNCNP